MENTVEMNAPEVVAYGAQAVDAPAAGGAEQNEISVSELLGEGTKAEKVESTGDDSPQPKVSSQKDFDTALSKRLSQENAKGYSRGKSEIENSPEMKYIRAIIDERAQEKGITREQAFRELNEERINARAQRYAKDPAETRCSGSNPRHRHRKALRSASSLLRSLQSRWQTRSGRMSCRKASTRTSRATTSLRQPESTA